MRLREITLFLVFLFLALFHREQVGAALVGTAVAALPPQVPVAPMTHWRYAEGSTFYEVVPDSVRDMKAAEPAKVAAAVCTSMGGTLDVIQAVRSSSRQVGFNCAFHEPGLSMSADFGELRRTAAKPH